jgi:hypothetical protein
MIAGPPEFTCPSGFLAVIRFQISIKWNDKGITMDSRKVALLVSTLVLWSGALTAATELKDSMPMAPTDLNVVATAADQVSLSWSDNAVDERGFYVQRSEDGISWESIGRVGTDGEAYRDVGLNPETLYYYRVFAYNSRGESMTSNRDVASTPAVYPMETSFTVSSLIRR